MKSRILSTLVLVGFAAPVLAAQGAMPASSNMSMSMPTSGFRAEFAGNFKEVNGKLLALAQAIPADKYTWRPAAGTRSIAEVFLHLAGAQYLFGTAMGQPAPAGMDMKSIDAPMAGYETSTTDKAKIVAALKQSFAYMDNVVMMTPDASAEKTTDFFGQKLTMRAMLLSETDHNAEHLGQMIAYARMVGVVPPWSMPAPASK
jgi:uncharacterized damage-inducible protein DinB